jgi:O-antigen/teichoic acid export membrane protein
VNEDTHLPTADLSAALRGRSVRGGLVVGAAQAAQFALNLASTAVLARLLVPGDFGLIAMVTSVSTLLALVLDLGLGSATVQRGDLTRSQVSALFWINTALGVVFAAILAGAAPLIAQFYDRPQLVAVTRALAMGFVFVGLSVQPNALLRRQMRFASLAAIDVVSLVVGIAAAIAAAARGAGYWSLVYFQLVQSAAMAAGSCLASGWRPDPPRSVVRLRPLVSFGAGMAGFSVLAYLSRTLDNVIIGRSAGSAALGLYLKSYSMLLLPVDRVRGPVSAVVVPALSLLQTDRDRFRAYFQKALMCVVAIGMPSVVFLFVFAQEAVLLVLGPKWQGSVVLFQVLAPAAFVETFNTVGSWACAPFGRSGRLVRWQIFATSVMAVSFLIGVRWGAVGVAAACSVTTAALRVPGVPYLLKGSPVGSVDVVRAIALPAFASIASGAVVLLLRSQLVLPLHGVLLMLTAAPLFVALYVACWFVVPGGRRRLNELAAVFDDVWKRDPRVAIQEM